ncbi:putative germin-like protein 2-1 [Tanacetum coccineum]
MQRLKSFQIWGFQLVDMISRIVSALVESTPVVVEMEADSLAIARNPILLWIVFFLRIVFVNENQCQDSTLVFPWFVIKDYAPSVKTLHTLTRRPQNIGCKLEGSLLVGFVTSNTDNKLFTQRLEKGDVFVFPEGLIHFQQNVENGYAVAIAALSSQNPGVITIANAVFGSNPDISDDILARAFQVDKKVIDKIQSNF